MRSQKGDGSVRAMSAETMKIPEPIIDPATSMVASVNVMAFTKPDCSGCALGAVVSAATVLINQPRGGAERNVSPAGRASRDDRMRFAAQNVFARGRDSQTLAGGRVTRRAVAAPGRRFAPALDGAYGAMAEKSAVSRT